MVGGIPASGRAAVTPAGADGVSVTGHAVPTGHTFYVSGTSNAIVCDVFNNSPTASRKVVYFAGDAVRNRVEIKAYRGIRYPGSMDMVEDASTGDNTFVVPLARGNAPVARPRTALPAQ